MAQNSTTLRSVSGLAVDKAMHRFNQQGDDDITLLVEAPSRCSYAKPLMWLGPLLWLGAIVYALLGIAFYDINWVIFGLAIIAGLVSLVSGGYKLVWVDVTGQGVALVFDGTVRRATKAMWTTEEFTGMVRTKPFDMDITTTGCPTSDGVALAFRWRVPLRITHPSSYQTAEAVAGLNKALVAGFTAMSKEMAGAYTYAEVREGKMADVDLGIRLQTHVDLAGVAFEANPEFMASPPKELAEKEAREAAAAKAEQSRIQDLSHRLSQAVKDCRTSAGMDAVIAEIDKADLPKPVIDDLLGTAKSRQLALAEAEDRAAEAEAQRQEQQREQARNAEAAQAAEDADGFIHRYHDAAPQLSAAATLYHEDPVKFAIHVHLERARLAQRQLTVQEAAVAKGLSLPPVDIPPLPLIGDRLALSDNGQVKELEPAKVGGTC